MYIHFYIGTLKCGNSHLSSLYKYLCSAYECVAKNLYMACNNSVKLPPDNLLVKFQVPLALHVWNLMQCLLSCYKDSIVLWKSSYSKIMMFPNVFMYKYSCQCLQMCYEFKRVNEVLSQATYFWWIMEQKRICLSESLGRTWPY